MPRPVRRNRRLKVEWPAWRYGPDGESAVFDKPEDVPEGWTAKPQQQLEVPESQERPTKEAVIAQLQDLGVEIDPRWGLGKLIEVLNGN